MNSTKSWLVAFFISVGLFIAVRPTLAQLAEKQMNLSSYLQLSNVEVGSEVIDGYNQVYYIFDDDKKFITEGAVNSTLAVSSGEFIAFRKSLTGGDQIFLYSLLVEQTIQLTNSGNNTNPKVSKNGTVVWEGWTQNGWQIFVFDRTKIIQLTSGDLSINPDIEGDYVIYARRDIAGTYRSVVYSIARGEAKEVTTGIKSKRPELANGKIILRGEREEEFPLTTEDLFVLDLAPLTTRDTPSTIDEQDILQELEETASAVVEEEVSPKVY